jgi:branched-chain amino acid transport system permease protein
MKIVLGISLSLIALFLFVIPPVFLEDYGLHILIMVMMSILVGTSWNILAYTGQISLGHAAFFGIGAYTSAITYSAYKTFPILDMLLGGIIAVLGALIIGYVCLRIKGAYLAFVTLGFAEVLKIVALVIPTTRGAIGISIPPLFSGNRLPAYFLILFFTLVAVGVSWGIQRSRLYFALRSIRENEDAANMMGVNLTKYKILAFALSAFFTGLGGGFYVHYITYIVPDSAFSLHVTIDSQIGPIIGGIHTVMGPVIGNSILTVLVELFRTYLGKGYMLIYGLSLVIVIIFVPHGILGFIRERILRRREN